MKANYKLRSTFELDLLYTEPNTDSELIIV